MLQYQILKVVFDATRIPQVFINFGCWLRSPMLSLPRGRETFGQHQEYRSLANEICAVVMTLFLELLSSTIVSLSFPEPLLPLSSGTSAGGSGIIQNRNKKTLVSVE